GTLPAMLATSLSASGLRDILRRRELQIIIALLLMASGLLTLAGAAMHGPHMEHMH
ncbi:MAG: sulfite exporter TauE/SafE, partial [Halioglobus sp.]